MDRERVDTTTETPGGTDASRNPRYIVILAIASGLILSIGWVLKPDESVSEPITAGSQVELSRLTSLTQRRSIIDMAEYFGEVAADLAPGVVRLRSVRRSAVVWSGERVVTARMTRRFPAAVTVAAASGDVGAYTIVAGPDLPLASLRTPRLSQRSPPPRRPASGFQSGEWVLVAWEAETGFAFAPGTFLGATERSCGEWRVTELVTSLPIRPVMLGGGVFDLDGNLGAVVLRCDDQDIAVAESSVARLLAEGETHDSRVRARWGLDVDLLTPAEAFHFGVGSGLMVREIWEGYPIEETGLRPGDILLEMDGVRLRRVEDLRILEGDEAPNQETFWILARRGPETVTVALLARGLDTRVDAPREASAGLVWEQPPGGFPIASVLPGSRAADAGIEPGDRLIRLDHQVPDSLDEVRQVLTDDRLAPAFIELARAGRYRGVLLP